MRAVTCIRNPHCYVYVRDVTDEQQTQVTRHNHADDGDDVTV